MSTYCEDVVVYDDSIIHQINERLTSLEQWIAHILTILESTPSTKKKRSTTIGQLDAKLNTILERLPVQGTYIF